MEFAIRLPGGELVRDSGWDCVGAVMDSYHAFASGGRAYGTLVFQQDPQSPWEDWQHHAPATRLEVSTSVTVNEREHIMPDASTKVVTGKVRLSYAFLFEPRSNDPAQAPKYSTTILIPKSDKVTLKKIKDAIALAAENGKAKFGGKVPTNLKTTLHDGDEDADLDRNPEYEGHYYMAISASEKYPPSLVDQQVNRITDRAELYSGCYARVSMTAFAYANSGNKGVSFGLNSVQKMADGEPLGGFSRAEDDFDAVSEDEESLI